MVEIGRKNQLKVIDELDFGMILEGDNQQRILLPKRYIPNGCQVGDEIEVFIYLDSEDRIIATTETPLAQVGEFAYLQVKSVDQVGAFLDWGLMKDLLVPFREQKITMEAGKQYIVYLYIDPQSKRITASAKINKYLDNTIPQYKPGEEVDLLVAGEIEIGYRVIINNEHWGMVYRNQVFHPIAKGDRLKGYIKEIRPDEKIDVNLMPLGHSKAASLSEDILDELNNNDGFLPINDKTPVEIINQAFGCSKKAFKMALGNLYKERLITISEDGIRLTGKSDSGEK